MSRRQRRHPARRTSWSPLVPGGINIRTRRLVRRGDIVALRASVTVIGMSLLSLVTGSALLLVDDAVLRTIGVALIAGVAVGLWWWPRPVELNATTQILHVRQRELPFAAIEALQILVEPLKSRATNFNSYELNVVLKDGSRLNLMDHGDLEHLQRDAAALCELLGCPLWDATVDERLGW